MLKNIKNLLTPFQCQNQNDLDLFILYFLRVFNFVILLFQIEWQEYKMANIKLLI